MSVRILTGDCRESMAAMEADSIDSAVTDPPYHLTSIVKRFGAQNAAPPKVGKTGAYARASKGFMGQTWDGGDVAFQPETWAAVFRVLKPGAHLVAFSGTRTYHRMVCAIEDAGFEIRDQLAWVYGSGFPKSHNQPGGWGTALKPAWEPICLARKPLVGTVAANIAAHGTGALNIDGCRIEGVKPKMQAITTDARNNPILHTKSATGTGEMTTEGRWPANIIHDGSDEVLAGFPAEAGGGGRDSRGRVHQAMHGDPRKSERDDVHPGFGDSGSAARFFASFPIGDDEWEFARNVHAARSAESPCDLCGTPIAGDPAATLTLDSRSAASQAGLGSIGICNACIPNLNRALSAENQASTGTTPTIPSCSKSNGSVTPATANTIKADAGARAAGVNGPVSATRFLYCPKATTEERGEGNNHPTVKPQALMRWLCRLVTPTGGTVLDPFAGSGSTLIAADAEQFDAIGCELSPEYAAIAERRVREAAGLFAEVRAA